jgi:PAS domain S-box-containing protein
MSASASDADPRRWPGPALATLGFAEDLEQPLLQAALTAGAAAAWRTDLQTRQRWWSPEMFRVHGLSGGKDVPADYMDLVHPDDRPVVEAAFRESVEQGSHRVQYRVRWPDGSVHWLEAVGRTVRDEAGLPLSISGVCTLIDTHKQAEVDTAELVRALRESQARQGFLLALTDVLRHGGSTQEILHGVCEMLGRHFKVDRVGYGHVDEAQDLIDYDVCWTDGSVPPLLGQFPASAFGPQVIERLRAGRTIAIPNVRQHPLTSELQTIKTSHEVDTRAILVVPLFKAGRLRTIVYLNQRPEREWSADDISLMEEVAERTRELIERGRTEDALRDSEARWRGLFERMTEGFFVAEGLRDASGRITDFRFLQLNPAFERLTGIAPSAAVGRRVTEVIPGFQQDLIDRYARVIETGEPAEFEVQVPALNDRWYEARARRVAPGQFSVLFLEVTERQHAQLELQRSADRYRTLFESIDEGFCILEVLLDEAQKPVDYRFIEVNPAFERQSGLGGAVGHTIRELIPDIESSYIDTYGRVALTGQAVRFESHAQALGRWFDAFAFRIGEPAQRRVALLFTDITERKQVEAALREADVRKDQFLATLAHELRNPLAPLRNGLAILSRTDGGSAAGVRARELMERQLAHLVRLVDDLLDVSRVSQGKVAMKKTVTSLQQVVDQALETARPLIDAAGHRLQVALPPEPLLLEVDATRMAQVLSNLLNNAAKYTPSGGHIALAAALADEGRLRITVKDDGVGIPSHMLEDIFELFTQVGSAIDRSQGGLGIGLSLARRLVELHGGRIHAESDSDQRGSTFVVDLPVLDLPTTQAAGEAALPSMTPPGRRVLVVDDNLDAAETLALLLEMDGHSVQAVHCGEHALALAPGLQPEVVFLDIGLPDLTGYEVAERLRQLPGLAGTWLVALTGWGGAQDRERARQSGIDMHLTKPVTPEDLARALSRARSRTGA